MNLELKVPTPPACEAEAPSGSTFNETLTRTGLQLPIEFVDFADDTFFE
jgi:hypothetical protein